MSNSDMIRIPVLGAEAVSILVSPLPRAGDFNPPAWRHEPLSKALGIAGEWWEIDLSGLTLADGSYEYAFRIERSGQEPVYAPDPYAEEITRFGGYRGVLRCRNGHRYRLPFSWEGELPGGVQLPDNNEIIIYELPMRWVDSPSEGMYRQIGLGTFDKAIFEHLTYFQELGVNAIELLPIQDSPDTLNWGYGTRFFFAPDLDMGGPNDLKAFIKECHRRGIRIILDVVMNHSRYCPLESLAFDMFYLRSGEEEKDSQGGWRNDWGGKLFRYRDEAYGGFHARAFHHGMAEFWIKEYHIDGFRLDEFKGIDNWDFIRDFRNHVWHTHQTAFPGRPFIVIAEDSWRRPQITQDLGGGKVVDAIWDFDFRDELRRLAGNHMPALYGKPAPSERVRALVTGDKCWDDMGQKWRQRPGPGWDGWVDVGFLDMAQRVAYNSSHDVEGSHEQRLFPYFVGQMKWGWGAWNQTQAEANLHLGALEQARSGVLIALEQVHATFALMLTSAGIPMLLAGEEFGELHDLDHSNWRVKMSDPIDWQRAGLPGHKELLARVKELIRLRSGHAALQRNEVAFFGLDAAKAGFHPSFDHDNGVRVFSYCRTAGRPLGSSGQVTVVANCGWNEFPSFRIDWPWGSMMVTESGGSGQPGPVIDGSQATLSLRPFQVRVFSS